MPGMFLEVDFGKPLLVDEARLVTTVDAAPTQVELRAMDAHGVWCSVPARRSQEVFRTPEDLRSAAVRTLVARGIHYLLVSPGALGASDFQRHPNAWGIELLGEAAGTLLYALKPGKAGAPAADAVEAPRAAVPPGRYDDPDDSIDLNAAWTRDVQFPDADRHTLTYSNIPGASASLRFRGAAVTYVYTRAFNRGIAEVLIDGRSRDRRDLYSARTAWRVRTRYEGLGAGEHVIEIRVTGARNPRASDCFVDLDELVVE